MLAAGMLTATSCSEFDDYNKEVSDVTPTGNQTLWENIQQTPQLSTFKSLLEQAGFSEELNTTHYYTVWAPLDGTFNAAPYQSMSKDQLLRLFVKNHIANYSHNASGNMDERVMMLNEKSYDFTGTSPYQFDGVTIDAQNANLPSSNGVMHLLNGVAEFYPHLYEFVTDASLSGSKGLDSLRNYVLRYETTTLDYDRSVVGPIVDGLQTYVDSVMVTENSLWTTLRAKMTSEDSSYTFLMPTNEAWVKAYDRIKANYQFAPVIQAESFAATDKTPYKLEMGAALAAHMQDSLTLYNMTRNLVYSDNDFYNLRLSGQQSPLAGDTLRSTTRHKLSNGTDILAATVEEVKMSNGTARIVDSLAMLPWETYLPEMQFPATNSRLQAAIAENPTTVRVEDPNPEKVQLDDDATTFDYLWIEPASEYNSPELDLYLPNVLSTTYDIYCVFVPQSASLKDAGVETLPNRVHFKLNYSDENGNLQEKTFLDERPENPTDFLNQVSEKAGRSVTIRDNSERNHQLLYGFTTDTTKVDTLYVGEFTFPTCYYGLDDEYCPNIKVQTAVASNSNVRRTFTGAMRIAGIILKPKALVEFEESNK